MIKNRDVIYETYFNSKQNKLYFNQLKELTNLSNSSLQNVIKKLIENRELNVNKTKSNVFYELTDKFKAFEFTRISLQKIEDLSINVRVPIKDFISKFRKNVFTVLFFGSASCGNEKKGSDLDLMIVLDKFVDLKLQKLYEKEIRKTSEILKDELNTRTNYPFSLIIVSYDDFYKNEDFLIREARNTGFSIFMQINYYSEVIKL